MFDLDSPLFLGLCYRVFHHGTRVKGERLYKENKVVYCTVKNEGAHCEASAKVQGSAALPYDVTLSCSQQAKTVLFNARCTCPLVENCKHIYAVLLVARDRSAPAAKPPSSAQAPKPLPIQSRPPPPPAPPPPPRQPQLSPEWRQWLNRITKGGLEESREDPAAGVDPDRRLLYVLKPSGNREGVSVEFFQARYAANGAVKSKYQIQLLHLLQAPSGGCLLASDLGLLRRIFLSQAEGQLFGAELKGRTGAEVLLDLVATGRCYWMSLRKNSRALSLGAARAAKPVWRTDERGWQAPILEVTPAAAVLPLFPPWYVDEEQECCGPLETGLSAEAAIAWLLAPKLSPEQSPLLSQELPERAMISLPLPAKIEIETVPVSAPVPCLRLVSTDRPAEYTYFDEDEPEQCHLAHLDFDYAGCRVSPQNKQAVLEQFADGRLRRLTRDLRAERAALVELEKIGVAPAQEVYFMRTDNLRDALTFYEDTEWMEFVLRDAPQLQTKGWRIEIDPSFAYRIAQAEEWYADAQPDSGMDWFSAEIGVQVDGQKINLLPILLQHFARNQDLFGPAVLSQLDDKQHVLVPLPDGRRLPFPVPRLKMMLGVLMDLFEPKALDDNGHLRLTKLRAAELSGATGAAAFRWLGGDSLRQLNQKLRDFRSIRAVPPPPGLQASLRGYQQEGLNWLQFLREYNLAGILADDMGLGKTVQALAHLLEEKNSGRADRPSLVVAPTSLMTNWRQEAERFAPALKLLVLHGQDRKQYFEKLKEYDLVITSYPLLPRDEAILVNEPFHLIILDEAQYIKNPKTKYAQIVCLLRARHHLCLTGTPMENHLGELWSQFNFLLPGFLGGEIQFRRLFRTPIEKGNDTSRREILARRIGPFMLRRRKEEVAAELPPKTEIRHNVELSGAQRDLYETIRLAMHARVQAEVRNKGMSRAHIIILDALLKLRQVCCDPRLVKLEAARKVTESAKLELLMDLVPEMLAEGRKILLFSQFTSMLALIEEQLKAAAIPYVLLTGETTDRGTPIQQFQSGRVPLFLISLKAGGTGLNLTAADTVIHYDPWWNPAVETQATDRAHRIGQTKSVFVYKLITVGTVEEKILALQDRKRGLVEGLLDEHRKETPQLTAEDLQVLFAPLS
jgi:superfamily II DNA or RNA helicase